MAQGGHQRIIGDYVVTQQIGSGSFAVVWRARHRFTGNEVAIKEIATERLNKKLQDSLLSEIAILRRTNHPNIIRLHEIVEAPNIIYLVLEYCAGGDLAAYIQRCGRVSEAVARHFMCQLGAGLQVLRANNLIHRDLKPQNLLLSTNDSNAVLKIADFGFARSLQPQGLAETLCGSPLYMAPEILQFQKYDAKADLWSVGAILFQLVTGRPPYCGNSHAQLLQNIVKSNDLRFPEGILAELHPDCIDMCRKLLRRNPVERLSFEEFFSHKFMGQQIRHHSGPGIDATSGGSPFIPDTSENSQEDCLPILLDEEPWGPSGSSLSSKQNIFPASPSATLFQNDAAVGRRVVVVSSIAHQADTLMKQVQAIAGPIYSESEIDCNRQSLGSSHRLQKGFENEYSKAAATEEISQVKGEQESFHTSFSKGALMDSLECIEREYVLVNAPLSSTETLSLSLSDQSAGKVDRSPRKHPQKGSIVSVPVPILFGEVSSGAMGSMESPGSVPSETSQGSLDFAEVVEKPSIHPPTRLHSLKTCARVITQLVNDKLDAGQYLEAFSIQLVCLAVWKEALQVCHKWADGASGSCSKFRDQTENIETQGSKDFPTFNEGSDEVDQEGAAAVACMHMEQEFFSAVDQAEQFASHIDFLDGNAEMPDALEIIFQSALALGKIAAVDELLENVTNAAAAYSKSATLLYFLLIEATSLPLNPPLVLTPSDRQRLQRYVDVLTARQNQSTVHRRSLLQQDDQQCHSSI